MEPQLHVIDTAEGAAKLLEYVKSIDDFSTYDCETTGVLYGSEVVGFSFCLEDTAAYYVVLAKWNKETKTLEYMPYRQTAIKILLELKKKQLVMHNAVFDCWMAEINFKISLIGSLHTDTMVLAHLLDENRRIGLKELAYNLLGESSTKEAEEMKASVLANGGEWSAKNKEMFKADYLILGKYGAKDAWLTRQIFYLLIEDLERQKLIDFFYEDESMPLCKGPTYQLNTTGLRADTQKLTQLKKQLEAECAEAKHFILTETSKHTKTKYPGTTKQNHFNIGSSQQLSWLLFGVLGQEFGVLTKAGKEVCKALGLKLPYTATAKRDFIHYCTQHKGMYYQGESIFSQSGITNKKIKDPWAYIACDKKVLTKIAPRLKWVERLLEYQRKTKILTTYVKGIEQRLQYGIIRPSFLQTGTTSGRYSSRNPNFQNLPRDDKRIKACILPRSGKVFVGADYSQLEPRVFAYFSQDERLLNAFKSTEDFYSVIGMGVYGKYDCTPHKEGSPDAFGVKYKKLRDLSKVIALASTYGATAHQLAPTTGKGIEETQEDINNYFEQFPKVKEFQLTAHKEAKTTGQVLNLFGRPRRMPEAKRITKIYGSTPHEELPYEIRNILNLAVNHKIQSTGASICNRAAIKFYNDIKTAGIDAQIVVQVHDSIVIECNEADAEDVAALLQNAMETAVQLDGVVLEAVPKIGKSLAEV